MKRSLSLGSLLVLSGVAVAGCSGDRCFSDDVDCIVDHMVLAEHQDNGARIELIKTDSTNVSSLVPPPPCTGKMCGGSCVNLDVDENNCGACGMRCATGQKCVTGACACRPGEAVCDNACEDLMQSGTDCGACGHFCNGPMGTSSSSAASGSSNSSSSSSGSSGSGGSGGASSSSSGSASSSSSSSSSGGGAGGASGGYYCSAGMCVTDCIAPRTACDHACVDTQTNAHHCGGCNTSCKFGESCQAGVCTCPNPPSTCGCVDLASDSDNCGVCATKCAPDQSCKAGICWPPPPDQNAPLAITSPPVPLVFTAPNVLVPFDLAFRDPNSCAPALCTQVCEGDKCSSVAVCTREGSGLPVGIFRSVVGFLAAPRSSSALFTMEIVPLSAPGCPTDLVGRLESGNTSNITVGALSRIPVKLSSDFTGDACTSPTNLCGCSLKACSTADGECSYEVDGSRKTCGANCNCASIINAAIKQCCPAL